MNILRYTKPVSFIGTLFLLAVVSLCSCSTENIEPKPNNVLSENKMIIVLTDIQLIEGAVSKKLLDKNIAQKESPLYYEKVFKKHEISKHQFDESINYYAEDSEKLEGIYEKVLVELSKIKAELQNAKKTVEETK